jgi:hypothetical protein
LVKAGSEVVGFSWEARGLVLVEARCDKAPAQVGIWRLRWVLGTCDGVEERSQGIKAGDFMRRSPVMTSVSRAARAKANIEIFWP